MNHSIKKKKNKIKIKKKKKKMKKIDLIFFNLKYINFKILKFFLFCNF